MVDPGVALGSFSACSMQIANESLSNTWGRRRLVVLLCLMFDLTSLLCVPRLLRRCAIFILASNPFYISVFFGGPVEEKAFIDLVKRWKLSRMGVNSSASVSGTRKTCWLECSGSLCVPSSACLVVRRYGTLHAHGREDAQHTSLCFETKHFERSMGGGVASPTAIVPRQLELALQEYEGAREVGVLERLWCRLGPCNVAHARWDLVMMRARPV
jgi:hypothetical protein